MNLSYLTVLLVVVSVGLRLVDSADDICSLSPDAGDCKGACPRYYYDAKRGRCRRFTYGCCGGNANNFKTKSLCETVCKPKGKYSSTNSQYIYTFLPTRSVTLICFLACIAIACLIGACTIQTCPNYPDAICRAVCPCTSLWLYDGQDVTNRCHDPKPE
ncbi:tissue factor pathway inhibitor 2-like [Ostrea edulis]|uniref:tissue factor pathway inhibitor 2-like n=1 Tax=Ostrea edulis TaxID=37623 RepID=UPI0024AF52FF|nr:tissue factor pathway inhibitor 2-like [Ostrea edulis]